MDTVELLTKAPSTAGAPDVALLVAAGLAFAKANAPVPAGVAVIAGGAGASPLDTELTAMDIFVGTSIRELEDELRRQARRVD